MPDKNINEKFSETEGIGIDVTRSFKAPLPKVWKAWTEPESLKHWWGPKGLQWVKCSIDFKPGGVFHYCMIAPNGQEMWGKIVYREIVEFKTIVFVVSFSDEKGNITRHPLNATWPLEVFNTINFTESGDQTTIILRGTPINASQEELATFKAGHSSIQQGLKGTLNQLDEYLLTVTEGKAK